MSGHARIRCGWPTVGRVASRTTPILAPRGIAGAAIAAMREPIGRAAHLRSYPGRPTIAACGRPVLAHVDRTAAARRVPRSRSGLSGLACVGGLCLPRDAAKAVRAVAPQVSGASRLIHRAPLMIGSCAQPVPAGYTRPVRGVASFTLSRTPDAAKQPETHVPHS